MQNVMPLNVLVVDDSPFFQRVLKEIINDNENFNVVGVADNGREAIEKVKTLKPDIVTMDYEMPMMDGVTAVRKIMAENPLPILMLSSMSFSGAKITIDALDAGAADFMTKNFSEISGKSESMKNRLYQTLLSIGKSVVLKSPTKKVAATNPLKKPLDKPLDKTLNESLPKVAPQVNNQAEKKKESIPATKKSLFETETSPKLVIIGASTGGPAALTDVLKHLPKNFPCPIIVVQHMPQNFTLAFSQRLNNACQLEVKEAEDGDILKAGCVFLAPGGKQLILDKTNEKCLRVIDSPDTVNYKPCIDVSMASVSNAYGKNTLAIVLTGMGSDGCDGARLLKSKHATVWTQAEDTCVVYGMPMAVDKADLSNASLPLDKMAYHLCSL